MEHWRDHQCVDPVGYMAMLRFDHGRLGLPGELPGTGAMAKALIQAGAPVDGYPGDQETPLARFTLESRIRALVFAADPNLRDPRHHRTPLEECGPGLEEVAAILRPLTREQDPGGQKPGTEGPAAYRHRGPERARAQPGTRGETDPGAATAPRRSRSAP
jgi:hypothetical protein